MNEYYYTAMKKYVYFTWIIFARKSDILAVFLKQRSGGLSGNVKTSFELYSSAKHWSIPTPTPAITSCPLQSNWKPCNKINQLNKPRIEQKKHCIIWEQFPTYLQTSTWLCQKPNSVHYFFFCSFFLKNTNSIKKCSSVKCFVANFRVQNIFQKKNCFRMKMRSKKIWPHIYFVGNIKYFCFFLWVCGFIIFCISQIIIIITDYVIFSHKISLIKGEN